MSDQVRPTVILIPGNGGCTPADAWYAWVEHELTALGLSVINEPFPDAIKARARFWLPHLAELGAGPNTILVGHSSGAVAAMRYAQSHQIRGSVLVGVCHTDLGDPFEVQSGYYKDPWPWDTIRANQDFIGVFHSTDDPHIPAAEARHVAARLRASYFEFTNRGHFTDSRLPEVVDYLRRQVGVPSG